MTIDSKTALAALRCVVDLQSRGDELLFQTVTRATYDQLQHDHGVATEFNDGALEASTKAALAEYEEEPHKVTAEELLDYYRQKRAALRELVAELGAEEFGDRLDEAELQYSEAFHAAPAHITYESFGYLHGPVPEADLVFDMRPFKDPHLDPNLRDLTANHELVMRAVFNTSGVRELGLAIHAAVAAYRSNPLAGSIRVAVGCAGGRHRSAAMVRWLLMQHHEERDEIKVVSEDRDIEKPVVER
ncbi:RNase adapter RapZ [Streptomyces sp. NPDC048384]|uniref:RapZ C-terminal domain-containing protein n=1 Tax=Streptomyces sp. NPDC048384 TaxID=3155487 RepID=UPI003442749F